MALIDKLSAIGDAIREKTGKTDLFTLEQMPVEIAGIEGSGGGGSGESATVFKLGGTPVIGTPDETVEKIYFNTALSVDEVVATLSKLTYADLGGMPAIFVAIPLSFDKMVTIINIDNGYAIGEFASRTIFFSSSADVGTSLGTAFGFAGWNPSFAGYLDINNALLPKGAEWGDGLYIDTQQNLYSNVISLTNDFEPVSKSLSGIYDGGELVVNEIGTIDVSAMLDEKKLPLSIKVKPVGTLKITENGTFDVTNYSRVEVEASYDYIVSERITEISANAYKDANFLKSVTLPNVREIYFRAFYCCGNLEKITLSNALTTVGHQVFAGCYKLKDVYYNGDLESWCGILFDIIEGGTSPTGTNPCWMGANLYLNGELLENANIPNTVTLIKKCAFEGCISLKSVVIPDSVTIIETLAFLRCTNLTEITIPNTITSIEEGAFYSCTSLTDITYLGTQAEWQAVTKGTDWDTNTGNYTVHCTDGDIAKG